MLLLLPSMVLKLQTVSSWWRPFNREAVSCACLITGTIKFNLQTFLIIIWWTLLKNWSLKDCPDDTMIFPAILTTLFCKNFTTNVWLKSSGGWTPIGWVNLCARCSITVTTSILTVETMPCVTDWELAITIAMESWKGQTETSSVPISIWPIEKRVSCSAINSVWMSLTRKENQWLFQNSHKRTPTLGKNWKTGISHCGLKIPVHNKTLRILKIRYTSGP